MKSSTNGRPTKLTKAVREEILHRLSGGESLESICRSAHLPCKETVLHWVVTDRDGFYNDYLIARTAAGFAHADQSTQVVEDVRNEVLDPQQAAAMLKGLHWAAERMAPKKHAPRQEITGEGGGPLESKVALDPTQFSDSALEELMRARSRSDD